MNRRPEKQNKKKFIKRGLRMQVLAWVAILGTFMLIGGTFAWYSIVKKEATSEAVNVMEPYYLTLLNPSETAVLQLSVGSLMPGNTKQVVFCVSNKNNEGNDLIQMGGSDFDYSMELIYTNNLKLNYKIYYLAESDAENGTIVAEDTITVDGNTTTEISYWVKALDTALVGNDVSAKRHVETGLANSESDDITDIINRGTYIEYTNADNTDANGQKVFYLTSDENQEGYDSQYFLMEIDWDSSAQNNFELYEKETDMIYVVVKALQPEPTKVEETP